MAQEKIDPALFSEDIREFMALLDRHEVRWLLNFKPALVSGTARSLRSGTQEGRPHRARGQRKVPHSGAKARRGSGFSAALCP